MQMGKLLPSPLDNGEVRMDVTLMYSATIGGNSIYDVYRGVYLGQEYCVKL